MRLVVDASVALKWVLDEEQTEVAQHLQQAGDELVVPDFWLNEAANVLWLRTRRGLLAREDALSAFELLRRFVQPTETAGLDLHGTALKIAMDVGLSPYDTLYVAFALAVHAEHVVLADRPFAQAIRRHPDPVVARMVLPLEEWARARGLA